MSAPGIFDQEHYLKLIETRGDLIRQIVPDLKAAFGLATALDAGCGLGFFSRILETSGLTIQAFDGRMENVEEARRRYPGVSFRRGDIEDPSILDLGTFDLVLCFGLLYHLENPLLAVRHLRALTQKALLVESMCFPDLDPWMVLRDEPSHEDQSLTDIAFYPSQGCLVKMLYGAGFAKVYRPVALPNHDDFHATSKHIQRRTILLASQSPISSAGFVFVGEPHDASDPWAIGPNRIDVLAGRVRRFLAKSARQKFESVAHRWRSRFPRKDGAFRLPFGARWIPEQSALDHALQIGDFEKAETRFVQRFLQPGMTMLDIGAHHGFYTLLASIRVGTSGKVIAFEPSPRERARLLRHVHVNKCENVQIESFALGSENKEADLFVVEGSEDYCNSLRPPAVQAGTHTVRVDVTSLDEYLSRNRIGMVDFIKMDVEGAELSVLKGASDLLNKRPRPLILAEVYDIRTRPWGYPARDIIQYLSHADYLWFQILPHGRLDKLDTESDDYGGNFVAIPLEQVSSMAKIISETETKAGNS